MNDHQRIRKLKEAQRLTSKAALVLKEALEDTDYAEQPKTYMVADLERIGGKTRSWTGASVASIQGIIWALENKG